MGHLLSKSKYIRGLQCDRALWLDVFNPRLAKYTREQMQRFDRGREFEYAFKDTFPNGIDISAELKRNVDAYPELTTMYLDKEEDVDLFEAGFLYDDVLVLADVVHKNTDGSTSTRSRAAISSARHTSAMPPCSTTSFPIVAPLISSVSYIVVLTILLSLILPRNWPPSTTR